jgi:hypothetical protein
MFNIEAKRYIIGSTPEKITIIKIKLEPQKPVLKTVIGSIPKLVEEWKNK